MTELHIPEIPEAKKTAKKRAAFLIKLALTIGALWLVFSQIDLTKTLQYMNEPNWLLVAAALFMLNVGQLASSFRMQHYFAAAGLKLGAIFSIALYYTGMLLNLVLPSGIGGDGYKAYYLKKRYNFSWKTSIRCVISGRGSGLFALVLLTLIWGFFSTKVSELLLHKEVLLTVAIIGLFPCYYLLAKHMLKETLRTQSTAFLYSLIVQGSVIITVILLLDAMHYQGDKTDYIILFQIATIVSVLPISIGGVGLREASFTYLAPLFALEPELGVALSLVYFVVNAVASLLGAVGFLMLDKVELNAETKD
jgi:uncharacterized membrane protein YbhN (UPF0104 family)